LCKSNHKAAQKASLKGDVLLPLEISEDMGKRGHCNVNCAPLKYHLPSGVVPKKKKTQIKEIILPSQILHIPLTPKQKKKQTKQ